jgi:hypothetical protein
VGRRRIRRLAVLGGVAGLVAYRQRRLARHEADLAGPTGTGAH